MYWPTSIGLTVWLFTHAEVPGTGEPRGAVTLPDEHPAAITKQTAADPRRLTCLMFENGSASAAPGRVMSCVIGAELARADRGQWEERLDVTSGGERHSGRTNRSALTASRSYPESLSSVGVETQKLPACGISGPSRRSR